MAVNKNASFWVVRRDYFKAGMNANEANIYAIVLAFSRDGKGAFFGDNAWLAEEVGVTREHVNRLLKQLVERGYLRKEQRESYGAKTTYWYSANDISLFAASDKMSHAASDKMSHAASDKMSHAASDKMSLATYLIDINNNNINNKKENIIKERSQEMGQKELVEMLISEGCDIQAVTDWLTVRKAKRAPLTLTAVKLLRTEAQKAGISVADAVKIAAENSWQSFKKEYYENSKQKQYGRTKENDRHHRYQPGAFAEVGDTCDWE